MAALSEPVLNRVRRIRAPMSRFGTVLGTYVFGSFASGQPGADSDLDVAVFVEGVESWGPRRRAAAIAEVQRVVGDDVELHLLPGLSLKSPPRASLALHVLKQGISVD